MIGIDIGSTAIRLATGEGRGAAFRIRAVSVRELPDEPLENIERLYLAALIEDAVRELRAKDRRCVCAIGEPDGILRTISFPRMSGSERARAARFEAAKFQGEPDTSFAVRTQFNRGQEWVLGVARPEALAQRVAALRSAGLKPVAVDHEAFALLRAFPHYAAVLDIGRHRSCVHVRTQGAPRTYVVQTGGHHVTASIEADIGIDARSAEKRKRILGTSGAGERARAELIEQIAPLLTRIPKSEEPARIAATGNGARLCGLIEALARAAGAQIDIAVPPSIGEPSYPADVARGAAPEWSLAAGLASWAAAA